MSGRLFDFMKRKSKSKSQEEDRPLVVPGFFPKLKNYEMIKTRLRADDLSEIKEKVDERILKIIQKSAATRNTDLLKLVFNDVTTMFEKKDIPQKGLLIISYYQLFFDEIIEKSGDMAEFLEFYSRTAMFGKINDLLHQYMQMLLRIQMRFDIAFFELDNNDVKDDMSCVQKLQREILDDLTSYVDDSTDWNKLYPFHFYKGDQVYSTD